MPLSPSAELLAQHLQSTGFVEVYAHHDTDGIAAASILCTALSRCHVPFHLHIRPTITTDMIPIDRPVLLCDFGSSLSDLPGSTMVVDHHIPSFTGEFHVNPRLHGVDGDRELSASGAAYLVAQHLGDNRDLAGLALLGVIGDRQEFSGLNREILHDGIANGIISSKHGFRLAGRQLFERLLLSTDPYLPAITGNDPVCRVLSEIVDPGVPLEDDSLFLSRLILEVGEEASEYALLRIFGEVYDLEREVIPQAPALSAVVDACGKSGRGGLAASLCLGDPAGVSEAWDVFSAFRQRIIQGLRSVVQIEPGWYRLDDPGVVSDIADLLSQDFVQTSPVFVIAGEGEVCRVSARSPPGIDLNLDSVVRTAASSVGGSGGGHISRAGATIPHGKDDLFRQAVMEAI
ncbi:MAG: DHH family phosphoesterase [Methanocalculus sp.]|uniref:single-stranded-DNA-specific exonuclease RecJ n=1 Tax=Methanocalculus sp. TaxID=2004547 RepID=UPI0027223C02|nr:DHH family phosphoesterase [Methanocalculus sp.]MDO9539890.1 DHH family phosphoesterase [Methanocalculus sp.]